MDWKGVAGELLDELAIESWEEDAERPGRGDKVADTLEDERAHCRVSFCQGEPCNSWT